MHFWDSGSIFAYVNLNNYGMKKILVLLVGIFAFFGISKADDRPVTYEQLPEAAKTFIKKHFPKANLVYATVDDDFIKPDYEVRLDNGFEIQFENDGSLDKIETRDGEVPEVLVPEKIRDYVRKNYPGAVFKEYEVGTRSYEVKLSNKLELKFSSSFALIEIDD